MSTNSQRKFNDSMVVLKMKTKILMKLAAWLVLPAALVLVSGCVGGTETATQVIGDITTQEASAMIQENAGNPGFVILDVRTPEEYADGYVEKALNLDYYSETFRDELDELDKGKTYLVYCRTGKRSRAAADIMEELGFGNGYNMQGGIVQWQEDGLPTVK